MLTESSAFCDVLLTEKTIDTSSVNAKLNEVGEICSHASRVRFLPSGDSVVRSMAGVTSSATKEMPLNATCMVFLSEDVPSAC